MSTAPEGFSTPPEFQAVKTLGVLHVIFSLLLMGLSLCCGLYMVVLLPNLGRLMETSQAPMRARLEANRNDRLKELVEREEATEDEEAKAQIRAERAVIAAQPLMPPQPEMPMKGMGMEDPRFVGHFAADSVSGLILNLSMFLAGIGLLRRKAWGRSLAMGIAWLKIVRLLLLAASLIVVVMPMMIAKMAAMPGAQAAGGGTFPRVMNIIYTAGFALIGAVYPIVTLVILARPGVKAAFRAKPAWDGSPEALA